MKSVYRIVIIELAFGQYYINVSKLIESFIIMIIIARTHIIEFKTDESVGRASANK